MPLLLKPNNSTDVYIKDNSVFAAKAFNIKLIDGKLTLLSLLKHYKYNIIENNDHFWVYKNNTDQLVSFKFETNTITTRLPLNYHAYPLLNNGKLNKKIHYKKIKNNYEFGDMSLMWYIVFDKDDLQIIDVNGNICFKKFRFATPEEIVEMYKLHNESLQYTLGELNTLYAIIKNISINK